MSAHALVRQADSGRWLAYRDPLAILAARDATEVTGVIDEAETRARRDRLHAVGFLTYEGAAGLEPKLATYPPGMLPPAWFALFPEPAAAPDPASPCPVPLKWQPSLDPRAYAEAIRRIREYIAAGDTYQVNFSYRLRAHPLDTDENLARALFRAMIGRQPSGLGALVETDDWAVCCASHELFFARHGRRLTSRPMKGTAPRGSDDAEDQRRADWLRDSAKNRAENLMITDMVRNDIGRLADTGSVHTEGLFHLEPYPTLWQMTSTVHGESDASLSEVFRALFPAASITGAPKRRTMEIIRELEAGPREIYTGTVGTITPDGDAQFNVAIRTALVNKRYGYAEYGVGGGILWDSDAAEEHAETCIKARILAPDDADDFALLETLLWRPKAGIWLLEQHLERLQAAARHFFCRTLDEGRIRRQLEAVTTGLPPRPHHLRLLVDAGLGIRIDAAPLNPAAQPRRVTLVLSPTPLIDNPLVIHKTTSRAVYETARREAAQTCPDADDVVLINERGELTESTIANLVVDIDGTLVTPPASAGLLPGVYRQHLLDRGRVVERVLHPQDLQRAGAIYLANSVRGLWPVTLVERLASTAT